MQLRKSKIIAPFDLWGSDGAKTNDKTKNKKKLVHPSTKRSKKNPLPHPGQSYNPDPEEHQKLLKKIAEKELKYIKKQKSLNNAMKISVDKAEVQKADQEELHSGIKHLINKGLKPENCDDSGSDTDVAYSDYDEKDFQAITKDKIVKEKRKTKQQRAKQLKDRLLRKMAKLRKIKRIEGSKLDGVKKIIKEIDEQTKVHRKKSLKLRKERFCQLRKESDPIYCLKSELPSNLRKVACPMDAIVREQLDNFQSRLMIEPTSLQSKKPKYKKKTFERKLAVEQEA